MSPQVQTLLNHLEKHGSISQVEAAAIYKMRALPRRIKDLREQGYNITSELKKDATGQRYARYTLVGKEAKFKIGDRVRVVDDSFESGAGNGEFFTTGDTGVVVQVYAKSLDVQFDEPCHCENGNWFVSPAAVEVIA